MCLDPVKQSQFILGQFRQDFRLLVAFAQFLLHVCHNIRDSRVSLMLIKCFKQIQLGVFLNLHTQIVKLLDRCVACQEV